MVEGRIQQLQSLIQNAEIIDSEDGATSSKQVILGSTVRVKTSEGKAQEYTIVGPAEADPREGKISNESPVGRALIGKKLNDEVAGERPQGHHHHEDHQHQLTTHRDRHAHPVARAFIPRRRRDIPRTPQLVARAFSSRGRVDQR